MINAWFIFTCKTCGKQNTGKTTDHFRNRQHNYKSEARKAESGNMENVKQTVFTTRSQRLYKTQLNRQTENATGWELLKLCILMAWTLRVTIVTFYIFTSTLSLF